MYKPQLVTALLIFFVAQPAYAGFTRDIVFPIDGQHHFNDNFADARSGGREHEGTDIFADKMTPLVSAVDGRVRYITIPEASWGYGIFIQDSDGFQYRYLHINNDTPGTDDGNGGTRYAFAPGIERGSTVTKGQHIAYVGDSGNAEWTGSHLHFEIRDPEGAARNAYESLLAATPANLVSATGEIVKTVIIIPRTGTLIKYAANPKVYLLHNKTKRHIADEISFKALDMSWLDIKVIPDSEQYRTGLPIKVTGGVIAVYEDGSPVVELDGTAHSYIFTKTLSLGDRGAEVSELQRALKATGHFTYPTITGYYGTVTRDAVIRFQISNGIEAVGFVGPKTRAALNSL